jgi:uncharacterized protein with beta-barrel porin domain
METYAADHSNGTVPRLLQSGVLPYQSLLPPAEAQSPSGSAQGSVPTVSNPWGWFLEASYNFGDRDPTVNEDGFDFDAYSATLGFDYAFNSGVFGASIGYDNYEADFEVLSSAVEGGDAKVNGASVSIFLAFFGEHVSFNAIASYGEPDSDVTRAVNYQPVTPCPDNVPTCGTVQNLTGSPDTRHTSFGATLAYAGKAGSWDLVPSLSLSVRNADVDGYTETNDLGGGGLALAFEDQSIDSTRTIAMVLIQTAPATHVLTSLPTRLMRTSRL